jgi:hypothetical protein
VSFDVGKEAYGNVKLVKRPLTIRTIIVDAKVS